MIRLADAGWEAGYWLDRRIDQLRQVCRTVGPWLRPGLVAKTPRRCLITTDWDLALREAFGEEFRRQLNATVWGEPGVGKTWNGLGSIVGRSVELLIVDDPAPAPASCLPTWMERYLDQQAEKRAARPFGCVDGL